MADPYRMRAACDACGHDIGTIETRNGQNVVRCSCGKYQYCAPNLELGLETRSVSSANGIKSGTRADVLKRDGGQCTICGRRAPAVVLHVGHLVSVRDGQEIGLTDHQIYSTENLATMCEECNLGIGRVTVPLWLARAIIAARVNP